jgi:hypothetical protein
MDNYYCFKYDNTLSRHNSNSSIYYDALSRSTSSFSLYNTPITSLTPVPSHSNLVMTPLTTNRVEKKRRGKRWIFKNLIRYRFFYWIIACVLFRNGIQQAFQQVFLTLLHRKQRKLMPL